MKQELKKIIEAKNNQNLAIFVGAGVSLSSNTDALRMPMWGDIVKEIAAQIDETEERDYLKIAQYYYNNLGDDVYYERLYNMFPEDLEPSKVHESIFDVNPDIIITTNWDTLLEQENYSHSRFYDVVATDRELVKSTEPHKIIKMHGDFKHKNIVFKEDDYLNYPEHFPLIENYIKSILSTHIVLFLGYSYNDINLKMIIQWMRNKTSVRPDMYLATFRTAANQICYLQENGITTIVLSGINNKLPDITNMEQPSQILYTFLNQIATGIGSIFLVKTDETIYFVNEKLKVFEGLNGILCEQLQKVFTNCGFMFDIDSLAILRFYNEALTGDYDREIRDVYMMFIDMLNYVANGETPSDKLKEIFCILYKSGIKGIFLEKDELTGKKQTFLNFLNFIDDLFSEKTNDYLQFDYSTRNDTYNTLDDYFDNAHKYYNIYNFEKAFELMEKAIVKSTEEKNYVKLFIALFNRNILLKRLRYDLKLKEKYTNIKEFDLEQRYNNLSKRIQLLVDPIYQFIRFTYLYQYLYTSSDYLDKVKKAKNTVDSGGFVYSNNIYQYSGKHLNIINFVLSNKIFMEDYKEYKYNIRNFVEIALLRQTQKNSISLSKVEIFSCIRYIDFNDLKIMLSECYKNDSSKFSKFEIEQETMSWLIDIVLSNCVKQYLEIDSMENPFEHYIEKILFMLSLSKHSEDGINKIFIFVKDLIAKKRNTLTIFQSLNQFLGMQYTLYNQDIGNTILVDVIKILIDKIIKKEINGYEFYAIAYNHLSNLYGYAIKGKSIIDDATMISELLQQVEKYDISSQISLAQNFLLNLYHISSDDIKEMIRIYVLSIKYEEVKENYERIIFCLNLAMFDFRQLNEKLLDEISIFIEPFANSNAFNSVLYTIDKQIDYLIKNKDLDKLKPLSQTIKECIDRYKKSDKLSFF
jgi:hypothetical protein